MYIDKSVFQLPILFFSKQFEFSVTIIFDKPVFTTELLTFTSRQKQIQTETNMLKPFNFWLNILVIQWTTDNFSVH